MAENAFAAQMRIFACMYPKFLSLASAKKRANSTGSTGRGGFPRPWANVVHWTHPWEYRSHVGPRLDRAIISIWLAWSSKPGDACPWLDPSGRGAVPRCLGGGNLPKPRATRSGELWDALVSICAFLRVGRAHGDSSWAPRPLPASCDVWTCHHSVLGSRSALARGALGPHDAEASSARRAPAGGGGGLNMCCLWRTIFDASPNGF